MIKVCKWCNTEKDLSRFEKHSDAADGHINKCRDCRNKDRRSRPRDHPSRVNDRKRVKAWVSENMDKHSTNTRLWAINNPDKRREYNSKYRAFKYGDSHEPYDRKEIVFEEKSTCYLCGEYTDSPELDHVVPLSRGGADARHNIRVACGPCNRKKHNKTLEEFFDYVLD